MMKSSRENTGEEKRRVMEGEGGDLIDWKLQAVGTPAGKTK